jgi:hypothetical protein
MSLDGKMDTLNVAMASALGEIRKVAEGNPQVNVMLQVLKFSKGAEWTTPEPVPVSSFQWQPMQPDELTRDDPGWAREMKIALDDVGINAGTLRIVLEWGDRNDLDLHVVCPCGNEISFSKKKVSCCGGWLDNSSNVHGESLEPREQITFGYTEDGTTTEMPSGTYRISVTYYKQHGNKSSSDYKVAVYLDGETYKTYEGNISGDKTTKIIDTLQIDSNNVVMDSTSGGNTDFGAALTCLGDALKSPPHPRRALPPLVVLLSDGEPTDEYEAALAALDSLPWGKKAQRYAIAIGQDADREVLMKFTGDPNRVLDAYNAERLAMLVDPSSMQPPPFQSPFPPSSTPAFDFAKCWQEAWSSSDEENEQRYREYAEGRWEEGPDAEW